jgi:hypothetical protein
MLERVQFPKCRKYFYFYSTNLLKRSTVLISEGDGNLFGTTNYQLPNPHTDLPLTLNFNCTSSR